MSEAFSDGASLIFRFDESRGIPIVPVHLDVAGGTQIVPAILRPDLLVTTMASQWADALGLSHGAGLLVQLATRYDDSGETWGPCERLTPLVDPDLDARIDETTMSGGFLLGQDFLGEIATLILGPVQLVVISREIQEP